MPDNVKAIKEMRQALSDAAETDDISGVNIDYLATARNLVEEGYGNIRQALMGFAEKVKRQIYGEELFDEDIWEIIDRTLKEVLGE